MTTWHRRGAREDSAELWEEAVHPQCVSVTCGGGSSSSKSSPVHPALSDRKGPQCSRPRSTDGDPLDTLTAAAA